MLCGFHRRPGLLIMMGQPRPFEALFSYFRLEDQRFLKPICCG